MLARVDRYVHVVALALVRTFGVYNHETRELADKLIGTRGVKHGTFSATSEGKALA
jgi:hypothetical protein